MRTNTTRFTTTTTTCTNDDGVEFVLPIADPYGAEPGIVGDTLRPTDGATVITYTVSDECGYDAWDGFCPDIWTGFNLVEGVDRDAIMACDECGYDHEDDDDEAAGHPFVKTERALALDDGRAFFVRDSGRDGSHRHVDDYSDDGADMFAEDLADDITTERAREYVDIILKTYSSWARGEVYGIVTAVFDTVTGDTVGDEDSCWGYIGDDHAEESAKYDHAHAVYYPLVVMFDDKPGAHEHKGFTIEVSPDSFEDRRAIVYDKTGAKVYTQYLW